MAKLQQIIRKDGSSIYSLYLNKESITIAGFSGGDKIDIKGICPGKILLVKSEEKVYTTAGITTIQ